MNEIKEINEIKEGLKGLLDRLDKLESAISLPLDPFEDPFKVELPEDGTLFYCVYGDRSSVFSLNFNKNDADDVALYLNNVLVKTKEEAEQRLKEQRLLFKIKNWAEIHNDGWVPEWGNVSQYKYSVDYSGLLDELVSIDTTVRNRFSKLPYFETEELAQECIDIFGDEIIEVLC